MVKLLILIGLPGSGKTTWAKKFIAERENDSDEAWVRVCRDDIRFMLQSVDFKVENENLVTEIENSAVRSALQLGKSVLIDATHIKKSHRNAWHKIAKEYNVSVVEEKYFDVSLEECLKRNSQRDRKVPNSVIESMYQTLKKDLPRSLTTTYPLRYTMTYVRNNELPRCIIVDIDGTIADSMHRNPYDTSKCHEDKKITNVVDLAIKEFSSGTKIVFLSGRCERHRAVTESWIKANIPEISEYELFLKPNAIESEPDFLFKKDIVERKLVKKYNICYCLDDRPSVCRTLRKIGLTVFQLNDKEF